MLDFFIGCLLKRVSYGELSCSWDIGVGMWSCDIDRTHRERHHTYILMLFHIIFIPVIAGCASRSFFLFRLQRDDYSVPFLLCFVSLSVLMGEE